MDEIETLSFWSFAHFAHENSADIWPGIDADASHLIMSLHRATDAIFFDISSAVQDESLSSAGQRTLFVLALCGPLPMSRLAELTGMSKAATWSVVRTLVSEGLVTRERSDTDRRSTLVSITGPGQARFEASFRERNVRESMWSNVLTEGERMQLHGILNKLMEHAGKHANRRDSVI